MNKKEQAYVEELETRLALRFTGERAIVPDVPPPSCEERGGQLTKGFLFNSYSRRVSVACSSSISHSIGRDDRADSQRPKSLYGTRKLALQAMRREMELDFARELRAVDRMIAAEGKGEES